jgi:Glycosyl-4,4'-diaponeurosporenoate acyltransferase
MKPLLPLELMNAWFRPKHFESERLYEILGARVIKRYVPTGGDALMKYIRSRRPSARLVNRDLTSLHRCEWGTRVAEAVHLLGFIGFTAVASEQFEFGSHSLTALIIALVLSLVLGLWPVVLQRYNRVRLQRAIERRERR